MTGFSFRTLVVMLDAASLGLNIGQDWYVVAGIGCLSICTFWPWLNETTSRIFGDKELQADA